MKAQENVQIIWTDDQVEQLRMGLLVKYTSILSEGYAYTKAIEDAWEWILADERTEFSFATIVMLHGVDPDTFQQQFYTHLVKSSSATKAVRERAAWLLAAANPIGHRLAA